eukprot:761508-Hanusia_phi.AAC.10
MQTKPTWRLGALGELGIVLPIFDLPNGLSKGNLHIEFDATFFALGENPLLELSLVKLLFRDGTEFLLVSCRGLHESVESSGGSAELQRALRQSMRDCHPRRG